MSTTLTNPAPANTAPTDRATATAGAARAPSAFGFATHLACRECGHTCALGSTHACDECFGPMEVAYDLPPLTRASIESGPLSMWRYASLLPVPPDVASRPNLDPGWTRLIRADQLAKVLGMRELWIKDERGNPTHSFKDRVVGVALAAATELGFKVLACPSTGNLANAVAAAAARAGIRSVVLIPADLEPQKIVGSAVYGCSLVAVQGSYDDVNRLASELADEREDWAFVNVNVRPYYAEGSKTIGFEIAEQLGWRLPEQIVVPVASGAQLVKIDKAFRELISTGLVDEAPYRVFGAQATGCSPVAAAFRAGHEVVQPVRPATIAKSLAIGNPADGPYVLDVVRRTGGCVADVSDDELVDAISLLASTEGIFAETAGGVTLAVLRSLLKEGLIDPEARTVIINSGDGLKTPDAVAPRIGAIAPIPPTLEAFAALEPVRSESARKAG
ncbi:MAG TPA: threonine synthase [Streptosporangiaceae bacterium]|nr:threonine synthase [Streptosporangiaceae bacterium]